MTRRLLPLVLSIATIPVLGIAACGDDGDSGAGAASVIPADAPLYIEAVVNPEGELEENLNNLTSSLGELPLIGRVEKPEELIASQLDQALSGSGLDISYSDDVQPWLGERVAVGYFFEDVDGQFEPERFIAALETTDEGAARDLLTKVIESDSVENEEREYEGVTYYTSGSDDYAVGVFDDHLVLTTVDDFETAVDTSRGGDSLAGSDELTGALGQLDDNRLAALYFDLAQIAELAAASDDPEAEEIAALQEIAPGLLGQIAVGLGIGSDQVFVESATPLVEGQPEAGATELLATAPDDVLGAAGIADLGSFGDFFVDLFQDIGASSIDTDDEIPDDIRAAFEDEVGIPLDDVTGALGGATIWARGQLPEALKTSEIEVGGQIEMSDEKVAETLVGRLGKHIAEESGGKLKPPLSGAEIGFSIKTSSGDQRPIADDSGDDLPFLNVEYADGLVTYGFFRDRDAAGASVPPADAGSFGETDAFATGEDLLGGDYELLGAADVGALVTAGIASTGEDLLGGLGPSPEDIAAEIAADNLGVLATGVRYDGDYAIQRLSLGIGAGE
jgi:hypothetical protein